MLQSKIAMYVKVKFAMDVKYIYHGNKIEEFTMPSNFFLHAMHNVLNYCRIPFLFILHAQCAWSKHCYGKIAMIPWKTKIAVRY